MPGNASSKTGRSSDATRNIEAQQKNSVGAPKSGRGERRADGQLLTIDEAPPWLRFNRFIRTAYRPQMNVGEALASFFSLHNESVNVWSHFFPALWFVWLAFNPWCDSWIMLWSLISIIGIFSASSLYHLMMPCCRSHEGYSRLILCDVMGALCSITTTAYSFILYGYRCTSETTVQAAAVVFGLSAALCGLAIMSLHMSVVQRFKLFGAHCVLRLVVSQWIMIPKIIAQGTVSASYVQHTGSFFVILLGGLFNITRIPECWIAHRPGSFRLVDIVGNSHNWWHVCCFLSCYMTLLGAFYDDAEYRETRCAWEL